MANSTAGQRLFNALEVDLDTVPIEYLDDYIAIEYFLTSEDEPPDDVSNLEKIDAYLQVFDHLCEASAWQQAGQILSFRLEDNGRELHEQLSRWCYYREQVKLYQVLLGKVSPEQDLICLCGLGMAFNSLSNYDKSFDYHQQQLEIAHLANNRKAEAQALHGIGIILTRWEKYVEAIAAYQQQLEIAREIGDHEEEGSALARLGWTLFRFGQNHGKTREMQAGLNHVKASLEIARSTNNPELISKFLGYLGYIYSERGQFAEAIEFHLQALNICEEAHDLGQKYSVLADLGQNYTALKEYEKALECLNESLKIARESGDRYLETSALNQLSIVYGYELQRYEDAILYCEKQLEIEKTLNIGSECAITAYVNMFNFYTFLNRVEKADIYLKIAMEIADKSDSLDTKGMVTMALANAYWNREQIWCKLYALLLVVKSLAISPPWRSTNGRIALQLTIAVLTKSAKDLLMVALKSMKNFLRLEAAKAFITKLLITNIPTHKWDKKTAQNAIERSPDR